MTEKSLPPLSARWNGFDLIPELGRLRAEDPVTKVEHHWGFGMPYEEIRWRGNANIYGLEALPGAW